MIDWRWTLIYAAFLLSNFVVKSNRPFYSEDDFLLGYGTAFPEATAYLASSQLYFGRSYSPLLIAADEHVRRGRLSDALRAYESVTDSYSLTGDEEAPITLAKGAVLANMSLFEPAERAFKRVAHVSRQYAHLAYFCLGLVDSRRGRISDAIESYNTALFYMESFFPATHNLGSLHLVRGQVEKGIRFYEAALDQLERAGLLDETDAQPRIANEEENKAPQRLEDHLIAHVLGAFTVPSPHASSSSSSLSLSASTDGISLTSTREARRLGKSLVTFLKRLQQIDLAAFHNGMGLTLQETGAFEDGIAHLRRALSLDPEFYGHLQLHCSLSIPSVFSSREEILVSRANLARNVREAIEDRISVTHPEALWELYYLNFQLPFLGLPAQHLMRDISRLFASSEIPILQITVPELYETYPVALSHATVNPFWKRYAPYGKVASAPPGAFVRPHVTDYFITSDTAARRLSELQALSSSDEVNEEEDKTKSISSSGANTGMINKKRNRNEEGVDSQKMASNKKAAPHSLFSTESSSSPGPSAAGKDPPTVRIGIVTYQLDNTAIGNLLHRIIAHLQGYAAAQSQTQAESGSARPVPFSEGPSRGAGTRPRFLSANLSNWKRPFNSQELDDKFNTQTKKSSMGSNNQGGGVREDPLLKRGYSTIPGVAAFNVTLFRLRWIGDQITRRINLRADQVVMLLGRNESKPNLESAREIIARENIDVLIFADPGIQANMYCLLFARMAPVQIALWGTFDALHHTLTLGLPDSVDYYVVGDSSASAGGDGTGAGLHHQILEQVVRIGDTGLPYPSFSGNRHPLLSGPPSEAERLQAVSKYGLLDSRHLYFVPQTVNAIHPDFDDVIAGILLADPAGEVMICSKKGEELWQAKLNTRLQRHKMMTTAMVERIRFVPSFESFDLWRAKELSILFSIVEVVLDTFPVGLGERMFDAISSNAAVVTFPSRQPLRAFAGGVLHRMGLDDDLIANSVGEYVTKAVAIGTNATRRIHLRRKIAARRAVHRWKPMFNDTDEAAMAINDQRRETKLGKRGSAAAMARLQSRMTLPGWESTLTRQNQSITAMDNEAVDILQRLDAQGYSDVAQSTLNDWSTFLGRVGRPWAEDREMGELEAASLKAIGEKRSRHRFTSSSGGVVSEGDGVEDERGGGGASGVQSRSKKSSTQANQKKYNAIIEEDE